MRPDSVPDLGAIQIIYLLTYLQGRIFEECSSRRFYRLDALPLTQYNSVTELKKHRNDERQEPLLSLWMSRSKGVVWKRRAVQHAACWRWLFQRCGNIGCWPDHTMI